MRNLVAVLAVMALVLVACGGGSAAESDTTSPTEAKADPGSEPPSEADSPTTQPEASDEPVTSGEEGTATATIGDTTWEFALSGDGFEFCVPDKDDKGLVFVVLMFGTDDAGREIALNMGGPVSGGEGIVIQVGSPTLQFERWTADPKVYDRLAGVEGMPEGVGATVYIDGTTISGSGVFYDDTALTQTRGTGSYDAGVLKGTFTAICPSK